MDHTSLSLLGKLQQSPHGAAWDRLVGIYAPLLRQWLRKFEVQEADADDLIQDVLAAVVREMPEFRHNGQAGAFRAWLRQVLVNRLRNFWRSRQQRPLATGASSILERIGELEDATSQLSRIWEREHDQAVLTRLMELIRPDFLPKTWEAFHRQMFGGQRADQVAEELGMTLSSVYVARSRVLAALRREAAGIVDSTGLG
jgi:RNA polymerase sigma factor (sigma-70 family)